MPIDEVGRNYGHFSFISQKPVIRGGWVGLNNNGLFLLSVAIVGMDVTHEGADAPDMSGASPVLSGANFELSGTPDSTGQHRTLSGAVRCSPVLRIFNFFYQ